jgi:hypothetical protein
VGLPISAALGRKEATRGGRSEEEDDRRKTTSLHSSSGDGDDAAGCSVTGGGEARTSLKMGRPGRDIFVGGEKEILRVKATGAVGS